MSRFANPATQYLDDAGNPLVSGKLYFFESDTDTPKVTYADVNLSIANTHPVILTGSGRVPNIFFDGTARVKLTDSDDVQIFDKDPAGGDDAGGNFDEWSPLVIYSENSIVAGSDGNFYISFISGNEGNDPTITPSAWQQIEFINIWNTNVTYDIGDTVKAADNLFYVSLTEPNQGNDPTSSPSDWGPPFTAVASIVAGTGITIDATDPENPIVTNDGVLSVVGGTGITVDITDPNNPIVIIDNNVVMTTSIYDPAAIAEQLVGLIAAQTLTNKTLTAPIIATISNTGLLTLPTSTDTLVGKATADVFTNKTFDANGAGNSLSNVDVADLANGTDGELITWGASAEPTTVAVGAAGQSLKSNGPGAAPTFQDDSFSGELLHIRDEKTSGTAGGTLTSGSYQTRVLNTVKTNEIAGASLSINQVSLPAGEYYAEFSAPAGFIVRHKAILYDTTGAAALIVGSSEYSTNNNTDIVQTRSFGSGRFTLSGTSVLELQHQGSTTRATNGLGFQSTFGDVEVYSDLSQFHS